MPGLSTAHKPLCVTPSLTLKPVSLNDKTGALRMTAPDPERDLGIHFVGDAACKPEPVQAVKKATPASTIAGLKKK
jgi:hypothetical protein